MSMTTGTEIVHNLEQILQGGSGTHPIVLPSASYGITWLGVRAKLLRRWRLVQDRCRPGTCPGFVRELLWFKPFQAALILGCTFESCGGVTACSRPIM